MKEHKKALREAAAPLWITLPEHKNDDDLSRSPSSGLPSASGSPRSPQPDGSQLADILDCARDQLKQGYNVTMLNAETAPEWLVRAALKEGHDAMDKSLNILSPLFREWCDSQWTELPLPPRPMRESATSIDARPTDSEKGTATGSATECLSCTTLRSDQARLREGLNQLIAKWREDSHRWFDEARSHQHDHMQNRHYEAAAHDRKDAADQLSALLADPLLQGITDDENALGLPGSADTKG